MKTPGISSNLGLFVGVFFLSTNVFASICGSNPGDWWLSNDEMTDYEFGEIKKILFGATANVVYSAHDPKGITGGLPEKYNLAVSLLNSRLMMTFKDGNETGTLNLPVPKKMWSYKVDTHDGKTTYGGGPMLYKEWRLQGMPTGTGIFASGMIAPVKYSLVLQGNGNSCDEASHFTHWRLEVTGKNASYAFYGELRIPISQ